MYGIRRDRTFIADVFENLKDIQQDNEYYIKIDPILENLPPTIDKSIVNSLIIYFNGDTPISSEFTVENIKLAADYLGLRINIDFNNIDYEYYLCMIDHNLFKQRMQDLVLRWEWSLPASMRSRVLGQFENCGANSYDNNEVQYNMVLGRPFEPFKEVYYDTEIKINDHLELTESLPWYTNEHPTGLILAGGAVLSALYDKGASINDYDFFIIANTPEEAADITRRACKAIIDYYNSQDIRFVFVCKSERVITFAFPDTEDHQIQIVLRGYESPAHVINGFDIDASCVGYTPTNHIFICRRAARAITYGWNMVDPACQSPSYEFRLKKYHKKYNLGVFIPGLHDLPNMNLIVGKSVFYKKITINTPNGVPRDFTLYEYDLNVFSRSMKIEGFYKLYLLFNIDRFLQKWENASGYSSHYIDRRGKYLEMVSDSNKLVWSNILDNYIIADAIMFINPQQQRIIFSGSNVGLPNRGWYETFNYMYKNSHQLLEDVYKVYERFNNANDILFKRIEIEIEHPQRDPNQIRTMVLDILGKDKYYVSLNKKLTYEEYTLDPSGQGQRFNFLYNGRLAYYNLPYNKLATINHQRPPSFIDYDFEED